MGTTLAQEDEVATIEVCGQRAVVVEVPTGGETDDGKALGETLIVAGTADGVIEEYADGLSRIIDISVSVEARTDAIEIIVSLLALSTGVEGKVSVISLRPFGHLLFLALSVDETNPGFKMIGGRVGGRRCSLAEGDDVQGADLDVADSTSAGGLENHGEAFQGEKKAFVVHELFRGGRVREVTRDVDLDTLEDTEPRGVVVVVRGALRRGLEDVRDGGERAGRPAVVDDGVGAAGIVATRHRGTGDFPTELDGLQGSAFADAFVIGGALRDDVEELHNAGGGEAKGGLGDINVMGAGAELGNPPGARGFAGLERAVVTSDVAANHTGAR